MKICLVESPRVIFQVLLFAYSQSVTFKIKSKSDDCPPLAKSGTLFALKNDLDYFLKLTIQLRIAPFSSLIPILSSIG